MIQYLSNRHILAILIGIIVSAASLFLLGNTVVAQTNTGCVVTSEPFFSPTTLNTGSNGVDGVTATIKFQAEGCIGVPITILPVETRAGNNNLTEVQQTITPIFEKTVVTLYYQPGYRGCVAVAATYDCIIGIKYQTGSSDLIWTNHVLKYLSYECLSENTCPGPTDADWVEWSISQPALQQEVSITTTNDVFGNSSIFCNGENDTESNCYELLTPLPVSISSNGLDTNGDGQPDLELITAPVTVDGVTYNKQYLRSSPGSLNFGVLVNILVEVIIGILGLGAVIMIVIGGMSYMSAGGDIGKTGKAKEQIWNAILGLLIALGSFIILNTINPNLLNVNPRIETISLAGGDGLGSAIPNSPFAETDPDFIQWAQNNVTPKTLIDRNNSSNTYQVSACDQVNNIVSITAFGHTFKTSKYLVPSILRIEQQWLAQGPDRYKIDYIDSYSCRLVAGNRNSISNHSFGLSIDINPANNPFGFSVVTDMPDDFVQLWKNEGWGWGGDWTGTYKDAMHYSMVQLEHGEGLAY